MGGNDVDDVDRYAKYRKRRGQTDHKYRAETHRTLTNWYVDLKNYQQKLVQKVQKECGKKRIYVLPILPRAWWGHHARKMAAYLDFNMEKEVKGNIKQLELKDLYLFRREKLLARNDMRRGFYQASWITIKYI